MTVKQFFKSTAFKCIITLLCVLLVSGIFLTIMNGLLEVTDQERFDRAINKIYGKKVSAEAVTVANYNDTATIEEAYRIKDDGNYLVKSTGKFGYAGGTVTCWVVVKVSGGAVSGIEKVVVDSYKGQTQMAEIKSSFLDKFAEADYETGYYFYTDDGYLVTNSTMSSTAICNAVNGALDFVNAKFGNVAKDKYKELNCTYIENIDTRNTSDVLVYDENENIVGIKFTVKTNGYGEALGFTVAVTVGLNGKISDYEIITNGSTGGFDSSMDSSILSGEWFVGKDINDIEAIFKEGVDFGNIKGGLGSEGLKTGATKSSYLCVYAAAFATANYDKCLPEIEITDGNEGSDGEEGGNSDETNGGEVNE